MAKVPVFHQLLADQIRGKAMSRAKFSELANVPASFLSLVLAGTKRAPESLIWKAVDVLGLSGDERAVFLLSARLARAPSDLVAYVETIRERLSTRDPRMPVGIVAEPAASQEPGTGEPTAPEHCEWKLAVPKRGARDLIDGILAAAREGRAECPGATWEALRRIARRVPFRDPAEKREYCIIQASYALRWADSVAVVDRRGADLTRRPKRITNGSSLLLSFSPDPGGGDLRDQLDERIRSTVRPENVSQRSLRWKVCPIGVALNVVNIAPDALEDEEPHEQPTYLILASEVLVNRPVQLFRTSNDPRADDKQAQSRRLSALRYVDFAGHVDRCVIQYLRNKGAPWPFCASGSAVLARADRVADALDAAWRPQDSSRLAGRRDAKERR